MLKFSKRKKLIAIGCSYTADWNSFPPWPTLLAEMLDMECVNLGRCAAGNNYMLSKITDTILTEKSIGLVVVMWSEWQRMSFQKNEKTWYTLSPAAIVRGGDGNQSPLESIRPVDLNTVNTDWRYKMLHSQTPYHSTQNTLRTFIHADILLKNIPYLFIQGTNTIPPYNTDLLKKVNCKLGGPNELHNFWDVNNSRKVAMKTIINSSYLEYIENNIGNKFIGWPIFYPIGGYTFNKLLDKKDKTRLKLRISAEDSHPNGEGHKIMAEEIYNEHEKIYS